MIHQVYTHYYLINSLTLCLIELGWINKGLETDLPSHLRIFKDFAKSLVVVNDPAERAVGMMQQFLHRYNKEEKIQNRLLTVDKALVLL